MMDADTHCNLLHMGVCPEGYVESNERISALEAEREMWEQIVIAKWTNHNGGGWTWNGMAGWVQGWRALAAQKEQEAKQ